MVIRAFSLLAIAFSLALLNTGGVAALSQAVEAKPVEPIAAITEAFRTHDLVALCDAHGNAQAQQFLRKLVQDPTFSAVVNDIVVEFGNARYQDVMDRYVRGEPVAMSSIRAAWQNTTVANEIPVDEQFFETVRAVNSSRPADRRIRILLGDPPIDWSSVKTREDHFRWLAMRDSFPAALVQVEVLAKQRKALLVWGQMHFQRRQILSNFDMSNWRAQTIVSLLERASPTRVYTIWNAGDELVNIQPGVTAWPRPSFVPVRGTTIGAADVATLSPIPSRMMFKSDAMVPVRREEWLPLRVEEQLDAILYLGSKAEMTEASPSAKPCAEPGYLEERLRRIALLVFRARRRSVRRNSARVSLLVGSESGLMMFGRYDGGPRSNR